jgi:hypothetical protein
METYNGLKIYDDALTVEQLKARLARERRGHLTVATVLEYESTTPRFGPKREYYVRKLAVQENGGNWTTCRRLGNGNIGASWVSKAADAKRLIILETL